MSPAELQSSAALLRELGDEARCELARLTVAAEALLDGGWRGQAALGFQRGWTQCSTGAGEIFDALEEMARLLVVTGQDYGTAEADSTQTLRGQL